MTPVMDSIIYWSIGKMTQFNRQHILPPQRQRFEVAMDLLKGCEWSCMGCMVDKELHATNDMVGPVTKLCDEFIDNGFFPFDFTVGATDLGSAQNRHQVCDDPALGALVRKFQTLSFTCAMLDKSDRYYEELAANALKLTKGETFIRFIVPVSDKYVGHTKLLTALGKRVRYIQSLLHGTLHEVTFIINVTKEFMERVPYNKLKGLYDIADYFPDDIMTDIVYNIPYGRMVDIGDNPEYTLHVPATSSLLAQYYEWLDGDIEEQQDPDLDGITGTHINIGVIGENYYVIPYLKDEFNIFTERFQVKEPTFDGVMEKIIEMKTPNPEKWLPQCHGCDQQGFCTEKGIHMVIEALNIKSCPVLPPTTGDILRV